MTVNLGTTQSIESDKNLKQQKELLDNLLNSTNLSIYKEANIKPLTKQEAQKILDINKRTGEIISNGTFDSLASAINFTEGADNKPRNISYQLLLEPAKAAGGEAALSNQALMAAANNARNALNSTTESMDKASKASSDPGAILNAEFQACVKSATQKCTTIAWTEANDITNGNIFVAPGNKYSIAANGIKFKSDTSIFTSSPHTHEVVQDKQITANNSYSLNANLETRKTNASIKESNVSVNKTQNNLVVATKTNDMVSTKSRLVGVGSNEISGGSVLASGEKTVAIVSNGTRQDATKETYISSAQNVSIYASDGTLGTEDKTDSTHAQNELLEAAQEVLELLSGGNVEIISKTKLGTSSVKMDTTGTGISSSGFIVEASNGFYNSSRSYAALAQDFMWSGTPSNNTLIGTKFTWINTIPLPFPPIEPPNVPNAPVFPSLPKLPLEELENCIPNEFKEKQKAAEEQGEDLNQDRTKGRFKDLFSETLAANNKMFVARRADGVLPTYNSENANNVGNIGDFTGIEAKTTKGDNNSAQDKNKLALGSSAASEAREQLAFPEAVSSVVDANVYLEKFDNNYKQEIINLLNGVEDSKLSLTGDVLGNTGTNNIILPKSPIEEVVRQNFKDLKLNKVLEELPETKNNQEIIENNLFELYTKVYREIADNNEYSFKKIILGNQKIKEEDLPKALGEKRKDLTNLINSLSEASRKKLWETYCKSVAPLGIGFLEIFSNLGGVFSSISSGNISSIFNTTISTFGLEEELGPYTGIASGALGVVQGDFSFNNLLSTASPLLNEALGEIGIEGLTDVESIIRLSEGLIQGDTSSLAQNFSSIASNSLGKLLGSAVGDSNFSSAVGEISTLIGEWANNPPDREEAITRITGILGGSSSDIGEITNIGNSIYNGYKTIVDKYNSGEILSLISDGQIESVLGPILGALNIKGGDKIFGALQQGFGLFQAVASLPDLIKLMDTYDIPTLDQLSFALNCLELFDKIKGLIDLFSSESESESDIENTNNTNSNNSNNTTNSNNEIDSNDNRDSSLKEEFSNKELQRKVEVLDDLPRYVQVLNSIKEILKIPKTKSELKEIVKEQIEKELPLRNPLPGGQKTKIPYLPKEQETDDEYNTPEKRETIINKIVEEIIKELERVEIPNNIDACFNIPRLSIKEADIKIINIQNNYIYFRMLNLDILTRNVSLMPGVGDGIRIKVSSFINEQGSILNLVREENIYTPNNYNYQIIEFDPQQNIGLAVLVPDFNSIILQSTTGVWLEYNTKSIGVNLSPQIIDAYLSK